MLAAHSGTEKLPKHNILGGISRGRPGRYPGGRPGPKPTGPCDRKNSIPIENFNPGSKFSIPIEIFNLDRKFQSPSFHLRGPRSVQRRARSKISIHDRSLEIFNPEGRDRIFSIPGPSGNLSPHRLERKEVKFFARMSSTRRRGRP